MSSDRCALLLATRNAHKLREFARLLPGVALDPLPDEVEPPPEETGDTYAENALIKARAAAAATGRAAIADDSGIEAEALGGAPGVRTARYAGEHATDEENLAKLRAEAPAGSALRYVCVIAHVDPGRRGAPVRGPLRRARWPPSRAASGGFGYDPLFVPDDGATAARWPSCRDAEKDAISHRGRAARALLAWLRALTADGRAPRASAQPRRGGLDRLQHALIALKVVAGAVTGSVAILTEAMHSGDRPARLVHRLLLRPPGRGARRRRATATATRSSRTSPRRPRGC